MWIKKWAAEYVREQLGIPNCRSVIRLDKEVYHPDKDPVFETRYYISSLDPDKVSPKEFEEYIRQHWEVENCLHWQKDRYYEEDKHVLSGDGQGSAWTILTNMALSLAGLLRRGERTLKEVRESCKIDPLPAARRLGWVK